MLAQTDLQYQTEVTGGAAAAMLIVYVIVGLVFLAIHIYVLMDILKRSDGAWTASGQNKTLWIVLWVASFCCAPLILDLVYWFAIRPKVLAAEGAGPGAPPGAYPA